MNPKPPAKSPFSPRRRSDLQAVGAAIVLLACMGAWWLYLSRNATRERQRVLAQVPPFPRRGDLPRESPISRRQAKVDRPAAAPAVKPPPAKPHLDSAQRFILNAPRKSTVGLVQFNALMNSPFVEKLDQCFPPGEWGGSSDGGFDPRRDINSIAFAGQGEIMTGFFGDDPASGPLGCPHDGTPSTYRGFTLLDCKSGPVALQSSSVIRPEDDSASTIDSLKGLIDQALDTPSSGDSSQDIYGDIFMRTSPEDLTPSTSPDNMDRLINAAVSQASSVTMRANVWDSVALTMDAEPRQGVSAADLAASTNAALTLARDSVDGEDVSLATYAELAQVKAEGDALHVDMALPTEQLVTELNDICARRRKHDHPATEPAAPAP